MKLYSLYQVYIYILKLNTNKGLQLHNKQVNEVLVLERQFVNELVFNFLDNKPEVICSFTTEFDDHIFVTVDADAFFFLHDLITSYVKEKEKVVSLVD